MQDAAPAADATPAAAATPPMAQPPETAAPTPEPERATYVLLKPLIDGKLVIADGRLVRLTVEQHKKWEALVRLAGPADLAFGLPPIIVVSA